MPRWPATKILAFLFMLNIRYDASPVAWLARCGPSAGPPQAGPRGRLSGSWPGSRSAPSGGGPAFTLGRGPHAPETHRGLPRHHAGRHHQRRGPAAAHLAAGRHQGAAALRTAARHAAVRPRARQALSHARGPAAVRRGRQAHARRAAGHQGHAPQPGAGGGFLRWHPGIRAAAAQPGPGRRGHAAALSDGHAGGRGVVEGPWRADAAQADPGAGADCHRPEHRRMAAGGAAHRVRQRAAAGLTARLSSAL
mmetsp:Transcript_6397/g.26137  ORF Transcript_6397/g.26137 Transcript_6397/m.26137 type:complete len:251 (+) Transcript_6397:1150-1902(+)